MTPIQKAKEIIISYLKNVVGIVDHKKVDKYLASPQAAALLSGEDWKEDGSLDEIRKNCVHKWGAVEQQWGVPNQSVCVKCGKTELDKR